MDNSSIRINKYLANLGVCTLRDVKKFLKKHVITVNGERIREAGFRINPISDEIKINGKKPAVPPIIYYLLNKPLNVVSATADEYKRRNIISFIPSKTKIYPVGRLDKDTTGLIILSNDGEFTNLLIHPKFHVEKIYRLTIRGKVNQEHLQALRNGVLLDDGITAPANCLFREFNSDRSKSGN